MNGDIWRPDWASMAQHSFTHVLVGEPTAGWLLVSGRLAQASSRGDWVPNAERDYAQYKRLVETLLTARLLMPRCPSRSQGPAQCQSEESAQGALLAATVWLSSPRFVSHPWGWAPGYFQSLGLTDNALINNLRHQSVRMWAGHITRRVAGAKGNCFLNHLSILFLLFLRLF